MLNLNPHPPAHWAWGARHQTPPPMGGGGGNDYFREDEYKIFMKNPQYTHDIHLLTPSPYPFFMS